MFVWGWSQPHPKGRGPNVPQYCWDPYLRLSDLTYSDEIWCANTWRVLRFQASATRPSQGGGAPASPKFLGRPHMCAHSDRNNQILHGDQTRSNENFCRVDTRHHRC